MRGAFSRLGGGITGFVIIVAPSVYLSVPSLMRVSVKYVGGETRWLLTYGTDPSGLADRAEANSLVRENRTGLVGGCGLLPFDILDLGDA